MKVYVVTDGNISLAFSKREWAEEELKSQEETYGYFFDLLELEIDKYITASDTVSSSGDPLVEGGESDAVQG